MKKLISLVVMLAFVLGMAATASAELEVKARGQWRAHFNFLDNFTNTTADLDTENNNDDDDYSIQQRMRTQFRFVFNENVFGEIQTEIGNTTWGQVSEGGGFNNNQSNIEVKRIFFQWFWPGTKALFNIGKFSLNLPNAGYFGNYGFGDIDGNAITVSVPFNEMIATTIGYTRLLDNNSSTVSPAVEAADEFDVIFAALPVTLDGLSLTPYFAYAWYGEDINTGDAGNQGAITPADGALAGLLGGTAVDFNDEDENHSIFWVGLAASVEMFDPFVFGFDFIYGSTEIDEAIVTGGTPATLNDVEISGYLVDAYLQYTGLDFFQPEVFFAYASGLDRDDVNDGDIGTMPIVNSSFGVSGSLLFGSNFTSDFSVNQGGFWLAGFALRDISFIEKLSHELIFIYASGTNDEELRENGIATPGFIFDDFNSEDSYYEVDFNHYYQIYESLAAVLELAYAQADIEDNGFGASDPDEDRILKAVFGFKYNF